MPERSGSIRYSKPDTSPQGDTQVKGDLLFWSGGSRTAASKLRAQGESRSYRHVRSQKEKRCARCEGVGSIERCGRDFHGPSTSESTAGGRKHYNVAADSWRIGGDNEVSGRGFDALPNKEREMSRGGPGPFRKQYRPHARPHDGKTKGELCGAIQVRVLRRRFEKEKREH